MKLRKLDRKFWRSLLTYLIIIFLSNLLLLGLTEAIDYLDNNFNIFVVYNQNRPFGIILNPTVQSVFVLFIFIYFILNLVQKSKQINSILLVLIGSSANFIESTFNFGVRDYIAMPLSYWNINDFLIFAGIIWFLQQSFTTKGRKSLV